MLLETHDVRNNDVVIYSKNKFDFENNFKIIFKQEEFRQPRKIEYAEVCNFFRDPAPKNVIVYRLLTNAKELDSFSTKYGYFLNVKGRLELYYFDPVFAIKDLKHLKTNIDPDKFRFKIQQVGLSTTLTQGAEATYNEVFSLDLKAMEAQYQNDKIFADAIFVFDETYSSQDEQYFNNSLSEAENSKTEVGIDNIEEVSSNLNAELNDIVPIKNSFEDNRKINSTDNNIKTKPRAFAGFIEKHRIKIREEKKNKADSSVIDNSSLEIFQSKEFSEPKKFRDESVVLKLNIQK